MDERMPAHGSERANTVALANRYMPACEGGPAMKRASSSAERSSQLMSMQGWAPSAGSTPGGRLGDSPPTRRPFNAGGNKEANQAGTGGNVAHQGCGFPGPASTAHPTPHPLLLGPLPSCHRWWSGRALQARYIPSRSQPPFFPAPRETAVVSLPCRCLLRFLPPREGKAIWCARVRGVFLQIKGLSLQRSGAQHRPPFFELAIF